MKVGRVLTRGAEGAAFGGAFFLGFGFGLDGLRRMGRFGGGRRDGRRLAGRLARRVGCGLRFRFFAMFKAVSECALSMRQDRGICQTARLDTSEVI